MLSGKIQNRQVDASAIKAPLGSSSVDKRTLPLGDQLQKQPPPKSPELYSGDRSIA